MTDMFSSPDDFAATDPREVTLTRRYLLRAAGLLTVGGLVGALGVDQAMAATRKTTKKTTGKKTTATTTGTAAAVTAAPSCTKITQETAGPYPGDGSNGVNVLTQNGIVRNDMRSSFGSASATAMGVPLTMRFALRSVANGCAPLVGAAFYVWHCDKDGNYSLYSPSVVYENYLRAVQVSDADGMVSFQTIFPGAYLGRWPHVHFEVYSSLAQATTSRNAIGTSQLAVTEAACNTVYDTAGYETSKRNFPQTPLASDNVFRDGWNTQLATMTGDVTKGLVSTLTVMV